MKAEMIETNNAEHRNAEHSRAGQIKNSKALKIERIFTREGEDVYSMVEWNFRTAAITDDSGKVIFEQKDVSAPVTWSDLAVNIVASKYFRGSINTPEREKSIRSLISRVVETISNWGRKGGYFFSEEDAKTFEDELTYILLFQIAAFNSPVWFNVGVEQKPQTSACFINSVDDTMESILNLTRIEGMLFKYGSGSGTNYSSLRSSKESVRGGGKASGPVSFMKGLDAFAGVIKSGGKTRRAAKMAILNIDHPDIIDFIECKLHEEKKAHALIDAGYDGSVNGEAYASVFFQNANNSVRVTDNFMEEYLGDGQYQTHFVTTGDIAETMSAREVMQKMSASAHACGDPGIQFDDIINRWNPCKNSGRINASNPCAEYMFLDNTACNLSSINLLKFHDPLGVIFDIDKFIHTAQVMVTAQEILVDESSYPTESIAENSHRYRPLGLGYANLGSLLMHLGIPYDSHQGRAWCGAITTLLTGTAYMQSSVIASAMGAFDAYEENRESFINVIRMHRDEIERIDISSETAERAEKLFDIVAKARSVWDSALENGARCGFRNAQATVLAPTGTIAFMMDCDTTGIEPDIALIKYKKLSGGGTIKIANNSVRPSLKRLGYSEDEIRTILAYLDEHETIEGAPYLKDCDLQVFDCAFRPSAGRRFIAPMGHLRMMSAAQPFLSGAISKTVNMPNDATIKDIEEAFVSAWKLGLKAVAVYRDGCKRAQPLSTGAAKEKQNAAQLISQRPLRKRLPAERRSITHRFDIQGFEAYITVGMYDDGTPGEIFLKMSKEGSTFSGLTDTIATLTSIALQYGVPLSALVRKFSHVRFEPSGFTNNHEIPMAKSIVDYCFRWLASKFLSEEERHSLGILDRRTSLPQKEEKKSSDCSDNNCCDESHCTETQRAETQRAETQQAADQQAETQRAAAFNLETETNQAKTFQNQSDAPFCPYCGSVMIRNASCYLCLTCGTSNGCS